MMTQMAPNSLLLNGMVKKKKGEKLSSGVNWEWQQKRKKKKNVSKREELSVSRISKYSAVHSVSAAQWAVINSCKIKQKRRRSQIKRQLVKKEEDAIRSLITEWLAINKRKKNCNEKCCCWCFCWGNVCATCALVINSAQCTTTVANKKDQQQQQDQKASIIYHRTIGDSSFSLFWCDYWLLLLLLLLYTLSELSTLRITITITSHKCTHTWMLLSSIWEISFLIICYCWTTRSRTPSLPFFWNSHSKRGSSERQSSSSVQ